MTELEIVSKIARMIAKNFPELSFAREAPLLGRSVDLAYLKGNRVFSVEFKLTDWRRALRQARDHKMAADHSYICLPKTKISSKVITEARSLGIGVLAFNFDSEWPFETFATAPQSKEKWPPAAERLRAEITESTK